MPFSRREVWQKHELRDYTTLRGIQILTDGQEDRRLGREWMEGRFCPPKPTFTVFATRFLDLDIGLDRADFKASSGNLCDRFWLPYPVATTSTRKVM